MAPATNIQIESAYYFFLQTVRVELQIPALIHCVLSFTEAIWTLNLISWRTVFAWDMTMIYDPTLPSSDWSKFHHMNQIDQWQVLLHCYLMIIGYYNNLFLIFWEKSSPAWPRSKGSQVWDRLGEISGNFMTIFTQTVWCGQADTWGHTGERRGWYCQQ